MSKVLIDRELLERAVYGLELAYETDTPAVRDICAVLSAPSGTPEMPVKAYYHESGNLDGIRTRSVGLEVRKEFTDAPLVLESDAMARIACLEGEIAKRDARIVELEEERKEYSDIMERHGKLQMTAGAIAEERNQLRAELAALKAQEPAFMWHKGATEDESEVVDVDCACPCCVPLYAAPVSEAKAQGAVMPDGWRIRECEDVDADLKGFIISSPLMDGERSSNSVWHTDADPAHKLLYEMLASLDEVARLNAAPAAPAADAGVNDHDQ